MGVSWSQPARRRRRTAIACVVAVVASIEQRFEKVTGDVLAERVAVDDRVWLREQSAAGIVCPLTVTDREAAVSLLAAGGNETPYERHKRLTQGLTT